MSPSGASNFESVRNIFGEFARPGLNVKRIQWTELLGNFQLFFFEL
jgi:hypothetical protein